MSAQVKELMCYDPLAHYTCDYLSKSITSDEFCTVRSTESESSRKLGIGRASSCEALAELEKQGPATFFYRLLAERNPYKHLQQSSHDMRHHVS